MASATRRALWPALAACALAAPGCYDGAVLLAAHNEATSLVTLDEIDLGEFRISLPHEPGQPGGTIVEFHAFCQVTRRDRAQAAKALALQGPELRYRIMLLVRGMSSKELEEPTLKTLRRGIMQAANALLEQKYVKQVGFHRFAPAMH